MHWLFFLAVSITLTFSGKTYTTRVFNKKIFGWLRAFLLSLYLNQYYILLLVDRYFAGGPTAKVLLHLLLTVVAALFCQIVVDLIKKKYYARKAA